jgi:hypothetical protein
LTLVSSEVSCLQNCDQTNKCSEKQYIN